MTKSISIIILIFLCVALGVTLLVRNKLAVEQRQADTAAIFDLSNKWVSVTGDLNEQRQVNIVLTNDLEDSHQQIAGLTNKLTEVSVTLDQTSATLAQTEASLARSEASLAQTAAILKTTQEEAARRDARIAELESQNLSLDKQALDLSTAITNLNTQISETERKLAAAEGDKAFLHQELRRLMGEKAELERQFNDLQVLRAQVSKLKSEYAIARRRDWIRKGLSAADEQKGAQQLMQGFTSPAVQSNLPAQYNLNAEIGTDGSVRVVSPLTNPPPSTAR